MKIPTKNRIFTAYFKNNGEALSVGLDRKATDQTAVQSIVVGSLIPGTAYEIYCYAEDDSEPEPNAMSAVDVRSTMRSVRTLNKVPSVRIARRQTLQRGFKVFVTADAPGRAWCAAAPTDYGIPDVFEIVQLGAMAELKEPGGCDKGIDFCGESGFGLPLGSPGVSCIIKINFLTHVFANNGRFEISPLCRARGTH